MEKKERVKSHIKEPFQLCSIACNENRFVYTDITIHMFGLACVLYRQSVAAAVIWFWMGFTRCENHHHKLHVRVFA